MDRYNEHKIGGDDQRDDRETIQVFLVTSPDRFIDSYERHSQEDDKGWYYSQEKNESSRVTFTGDRMVQLYQNSST